MKVHPILKYLPVFLLFACNNAAVTEINNEKKNND